jgi:transcriptional regulator of acetoin/glycerol metabolism
MTVEATVTAPSPPGGEARSAAAGLAICWILPSLAGSVTPLEGGVLTLGRDPACGVVLTGQEVSRRHAELRREGPLWIVRDLGSRNGLFVRGARRKEAPVGPGDTLRLGEWLGVLTAIHASAERAPSGKVFDWIGGGLRGGPTLRAALAPALRGAGSDLPVLVEGETGTGKELVARLVHEASGRAGPFLALNCAALPASIAEGELFGVAKGAFTGADRPRAGHFRTAHGGTLFLDEIADLPAELQAKLLRAIEQREVLPIGESAPVPIDVRIVAASQTPLEPLVERGRFRADLFARLDGLRVRLPPLRARVEEVPSLFVALLQEHTGGRAPRAGIDVMERLCLHGWPLNVRELVMLTRKLLATRGDAGPIDVHELPLGPGADAPRAAAEPQAAAPDDQVPPAELARLEEALRASKGNVAVAAARLGISRPKAYRLMKSARFDWARLRG